MSQIFGILFQTENINNFVLHGVIFSRSVQLKSCFSDEKNTNVKIWDTLQQRRYQSLMRQSIIEKSHHWLKLELSKVVHNAKLH